MKMQLNKGFTLVEIAIVLVIVGLLIGGVLKGQEMITTAKLGERVMKKNNTEQPVDPMSICLFHKPVLSEKIPIKIPIRKEA